MERIRETLWKLRQEVILCSLYRDDYKNSYGIEEYCCMDFFDGYANYLGELMEEDGIGDEDFFLHLADYDKPENLQEWFYEYTAGYKCDDAFSLKITEAAGVWTN